LNYTTIKTQEALHDIIRCEAFGAKHLVRSTWYFRKLNLLVIV